MGVGVTVQVCESTSNRCKLTSPQNLLVGQEGNMHP